MSGRDDGGLAFPRPHSTDRHGDSVWDQEGMTLRDYFAAKALPAVIKACAGDTMHGMAKADYFAGRAYELADAMLAARGAA